MQLAATTRHTGACSRCTTTTTTIPRYIQKFILPKPAMCDNRLPAARASSTGLCHYLRSSVQTRLRFLRQKTVVPIAAGSTVLCTLYTQQRQVTCSQRKEAAAVAEPPPLPAAPVRSVCCYTQLTHGRSTTTLH